MAFTLSRGNKATDKKLVKKATTTIKTVKTVKGKDIISQINQIKALVETKLGKYKDEYIIISDESTLIDYIDVCIENGIISLDTETTGLDPLLDEIVGICIYTPGEKGAYIPINHVSYITLERTSNQLDIDFLNEQFTRLYDNEVESIMFNGKFDIRVMRNKVGVKNIYCTWDSYLAQRCLNENEPYNGLKPLHEKYVLNGEGDAWSFGDLFKNIPFSYIPINTAYLYAARDPVITYELYDYQKKYLKEDTDREDLKNVYWVFKNIEMPCIPVVADMEDNGISFDKKYAHELSIKYNKILQDKIDSFHEVLSVYEDDIDKYRGRGEDKLDNPINIGSPTQIAILLYDILKVGVVDKKSPRGTGEEILDKLVNKEKGCTIAKLCQAILDYREISKLLSTYIDKLPNCVNPHDHRIHCSFNQYGAVTGRMSSSDPNLQNIPSHNKDVRKMFIASEGYLLMSSDFSQQEPKCLAAMCRQQGDDQMYKTFMEGKDLYSEIASKAFNKSYDECREFRADGTTSKEGKERRTQAKSILLGVLYGRGEKSIGEQLNCSEKKAKEIKESVFRGFPAIKRFEQSCLEMAEDLGYVTTVCGRKRRLPDMQLPEYEFMWKDGAPPDDDLLDFDGMNEPEYNTTEVPEDIIRKYEKKLSVARYDKKWEIKQQADKEGIRIIDNGGKIADATRQCVNSRIQGSAADLTKLAMIKLNNNERLKELGFRLLIPVHDEVIAECPEENIKECSLLLASTMSEAAEAILQMPIKCDVSISKEWYGEELKI